MLRATSKRVFGPSVLHSMAFLERRFRAHIMVRDRLLFDSAFVPTATVASPFVHLYAQVRGAIAIAGGAAVTEPQAYVLAATEFDRMIPGSTTLRSWGAPGVVIELRVSAADMRAPVGLRHGAVELPARVWDAYAALDAESTTAHLHELIVRLGDAGIIATDLPGSIVSEEPARFVRLWESLSPLYEDFSTATSVKQLATLAKLSLRQLGRDLDELIDTFALYGTSFREAIRVLRIRAATLLLSSPGTSVTDVARAVGYGSVTSMGRAFRDAKLPAPSVVQAAVRYPED